jgi:hypothetical protein
MEGGLTFEEVCVESAHVPELVFHFGRLVCADLDMDSEDPAVVAEKHLRFRRFVYEVCWIRMPIDLRAGTADPYLLHRTSCPFMEGGDCTCEPKIEGEKLLS